MRFGYRQLSIYVVAPVEALRNTQVASGIAIEGLFEGLMAGRLVGNCQDEPAHAYSRSTTFRVYRFNVDVRRENFPDLPPKQVFFSP